MVSATPEVKSVVTYHTRMADQLLQRLLTLDKLMLNDNSVEKGTICEQWFRSLLQDVLPLRFGLGWGHVSWGDESLEATSPLDVIIYDHHNHSPHFVEGNFVVVPPEALLAVVEVKAVVREGSRNLVKKACTQLDKLRRRLASRLPDDWGRGVEFPGFVLAFSPLDLTLPEDWLGKHPGVVRGFANVGKDFAQVWVDQEWHKCTRHGFAYWYWQLLDTLYDAALNKVGEGVTRAPVPPNWRKMEVFGDEQERGV